jgi:transcription antitermination factor NusG
LIVVEDQDKLVQELLPIETMLKLGKTVLPHDYIQIGQKCRVIAGPLAGSVGMVVQTPKETRLILQVDMLGQAASVEIDSDMVEKLEQ